jgi:hypothetical protein
MNEEFKDEMPSFSDLGRSAASNNGGNAKNRGQA